MAEALQVREQTARGCPRGRWLRPDPRCPCPRPFQRAQPAPTGGRALLQSRSPPRGLSVFLPMAHLTPSLPTSFPNTPLQASVSPAHPTPSAGALLCPAHTDLSTSKSTTPSSFGLHSAKRSERWLWRWRLSIYTTGQARAVHRAGAAISPTPAPGLQAEWP